MGFLSIGDITSNHPDTELISRERHESSKSNKDFFNSLIQLSNTSKQSNVLMVKDHNIDTTGDFSQQIMNNIANEVNNYTREVRAEIKRDIRVKFISQFSYGLIKNKSEDKKLIDKMNRDMFVDLSRGRYFIGDTEISKAGDENQSFASFEREVKKNQFKWIDDNIEIISKFFHQGFVQIVLAQAFKKEFKSFDNGLNIISLDRDTQNIEYHLNADKSIELVISSRVRNAGYIAKKNESGDGKLVISDDEKNNFINSRAIPSSQLYVRIALAFKNGEFHINDQKINHYFFHLAAKEITKI